VLVVREQRIKVLLAVWQNNSLVVVVAVQAQLVQTVPQQLQHLVLLVTAGQDYLRQLLERRLLALAVAAAAVVLHQVIKVLVLVVLAVVATGKQMRLVTMEQQIQVQVVVQEDLTVPSITAAQVVQAL
jgi:hypothetical protein